MVGVSDLATEEEKEFYQHWLDHVRRVRTYLGQLAEALWERGKTHDASKLSPPELGIFAANFKRLKKIKWGTPKYEEAIKVVQEAKDHHYANNRHHPEFFGERGCCGMNLVDLVEMYCDWKSANKRGVGPPFEKSIKICCKKFNIPPMLEQIFLNTAREYREL